MELSLSLLSISAEVTESITIIATMMDTVSLIKMHDVIIAIKIAIISLLLLQG